MHQQTSSSGLNVKYYIFSVCLLVLFVCFGVFLVVVVWIFLPEGGENCSANQLGKSVKEPLKV